MQRKIENALVRLNLNERPISLESATAYCEAKEIIVKLVTMSWHGIYFKRRERHCIALSESLSAMQLLKVFTHEIGHYLLHTPTTCFFGDQQRKMDFEADVFAACAIIPRRLIETKTRGELKEEYGFTNSQLAFRYRIYQRFGL